MVWPLVWRLVSDRVRLPGGGSGQIARPVNELDCSASESGPLGDRAHHREVEGLSPSPGTEIRECAPAGFSSRRACSFHPCTRCQALSSASRHDDLGLFSSSPEL